MITEQYKQTQEELVIEMLSIIHGATSRELASYFEVDQYMVSRRLSDLKNKNIVKVGGHRKCRVTRDMCLTWCLK